MNYLRISAVIGILTLTGSICRPQCTSNESPQEGLRSCNGGCSGGLDPALECMAVIGPHCNNNATTGTCPDFSGCTINEAASCVPHAQTSMRQGTTLDLNRLQFASLDRATHGGESSCFSAKAFEDWAHGKVQLRNLLMARAR